MRKVRSVKGLGVVSMTKAVGPALTIDHRREIYSNLTHLQKEPELARLFLFHPPVRARPLEK